MKLLFTLCLILGIASLCSAQENYSEQYGKITQYEMSMTEYENDPEAEALVIYSLGNNYFRGDDGVGFFLHMEVSKKIKILKQAGVSYANIEIPYYTGDRGAEEIQDIEAIVYNMEGGKLVKSYLDKKKIFEEKVNSDYFLKKLALPDVREGSIIEYKYKIKTPYFFNMRRWYFQEKIPVIHSRLNYKAIPYYEYTYIVRGTTEFDEFETKTPNRDVSFAGLTYKEKEYTFGMKNLQAFRDEDFISSEKDYIISIIFQISRTYSFYNGAKRDYMSTWPDMCDEFLKSSNFGKYIKDSEKEAKKILPSLNLTGASTLEQAKLITQYVRNMYSWDGFNDKFSTNKLSDFLKLKKGNVADINLHLIGLLKAANISTNPVVLSTRANGAISKSHPFQQYLNYVIARVSIDGYTYFIDASEPLRYFDELPTRCINVEGLVVKPKSEEWTVTSQKEIASTCKKFKINIKPEKSLLYVDISYTLKGEDAYQYRDIYGGKDENLKEYFRKKNNILDIDSLNIQNYDKADQPFEFTFKTQTSFENVSGKLFIHPFCNLSVSQNIFKHEKRSLPVDLVYLQEEAFVSTITIPEGYKIEHLPDSVDHNGRIMAILYKTKVTDNTIQIEASYKFQANIYDAKDYIRLKNSFAVLTKHLSDMIVLSRKE